MAILELQNKVLKVVFQWENVGLFSFDDTLE